MRAGSLTAAAVGAIHGETFPSLLSVALAEQARRRCVQLSHTEHVLRLLVGGIPSTPNGSGVRAALTNNKLEQGEGKQQQYLCFPLHRALFLDRKIGQVRAEQLGGLVTHFQRWTKRKEGSYVYSFSTNIFLAVVIIKNS